MQERRERGLKRKADGRWQWSYKDSNGKYCRHIARTKSEARAYLEKVRTLMREGRYMDRRKENKTTFEEAVKQFMKWSATSTRARSHVNDKVNAHLWLDSPYFKGKKLDKITGGDVEQFKQDRLKDLDCRGPSLEGFVRLSGKLYYQRSGKTLKHTRREEVRSALSQLLVELTPYQVRRVLQEYFVGAGSLNITQFRTELAAIAKRPEFRRKGRPITKRTVDISLARLKRLFALCVEWGLCTHNPAAKVKLFREDQKRTRFLSEDEERRLLSACPDPLHKVVTFALHTGMRRGEILGLRWRDVDTQNGIASIPGVRAKGHRDRHVPLNSVALGILEEVTRSKDRNAYVFGNAKGKLNDYLRRQWQLAIERSELEDFRFHDLRHTYASRLVMAGIDLAVLRELLGHRDFEMTLRYAHLAPSRLKSAVAVLEPKLQFSCNPTRPQNEGTGALACQTCD